MNLLFFHTRFNSITRCHKQWFCQPESHSELIMCPPQKLSHTFFYDNWTHSRVHTGKKTLIPDNLELLSIIFNSSINARCIRSLHIIGFIQEEISCNLCSAKKNNNKIRNKKKKKKKMRLITNNNISSKDFPIIFSNIFENQILHAVIKLTSNQTIFI